MTECPCCGQTMPSVELPTGLHLRGKRLELYNIVRRAGKNGITSDIIFDRLYGGDPNGGPESGMRIISTVVCAINKRIKPFGQRLQGGATGHGVPGEYRLVRLDA